jgi:hypothetical protein
MRNDVVHQFAMAVAMKMALNSYFSKHGPVRADVIQASLGSIVTETFIHIKDEAERTRLLDSFCTILRESVADNCVEEAVLQ